MSLRKAHRYVGSEQMSDTQLLALLLSPGRPPRVAERMAHDLLEQFGDLGALYHLEAEEMTRVSGIGEATAAAVHAALLLGRRSLTRTTPSRSPILGPHDAAPLLAPALRDLPHEEFHALYLSTRLLPIAHRKLSRGTHESTLISPQLIFRTAMAIRATSVILAHNHPGGACAPSRSDERTTNQLKAAGELVGVMVLDHLIVGGQATYSMTEKYKIAHDSSVNFVKLRPCGRPSTKLKVLTEHSGSTATGYSSCSPSLLPSFSSMTALKK